MQFSLLARWLEYDKLSAPPFKNQKLLKETLLHIRMKQSTFLTYKNETINHYTLSSAE